MCLNVFKCDSLNNKKSKRAFIERPFFMSIQNTLIRLNTLRHIIALNLYSHLTIYVFTSDH